MSIEHNLLNKTWSARPGARARTHTHRIYNADEQQQQQDYEGTN